MVVVEGERRERNSVGSVGGGDIFKHVKRISLQSFWFAPLTKQRPEGVLVAKRNVEKVQHGKDSKAVCWKEVMCCCCCCCFGPIVND